jgi:xanthine phosphoribosyltransferase
MGEEWKHRFAGKPINKVVTIEASGIGIACIVAKYCQWKLLFFSLYSFYPLSPV